MRAFAALVALGTLAGVAPSVGGQDVTGTWTVTWDSDINTSGDVVTVKKRSTGRLVLEQRGDSVFGRFQPDGMPDPNRPLRGTFDGKVIKLTTGSLRRTVTMNGTPTEMMTRTDWMGAFDGTFFKGTIFVQVGDRPAPPRKWEAVRGGG
jgi:hypothetical protein